MTDMTIPEQVDIPIVFTIRQASDNTVLYQDHQTFTIVRTDHIATLLEGAARRSGRPAAKILEKLVLTAVQDQLREDRVFTEILRASAGVVRLTVTFADITY
jgi:hypothetical protein